MEEVLSFPNFIQSKRPIGKVKACERLLGVAEVYETCTIYDLEGEAQPLRLKHVLDFDFIVFPNFASTRKEETTSGNLAVIVTYEAVNEVGMEFKAWMLEHVGHGQASWQQYMVDIIVPSNMPQLNRGQSKRGVLPIESQGFMMSCCGNRIACTSLPLEAILLWKVFTSVPNKRFTISSARGFKTNTSFHYVLVTPEYLFAAQEKSILATPLEGKLTWMVIDMPNQISEASMVSNTSVVCTDIEGVVYLVGVGGVGQFQNLFTIQLETPLPFHHLCVLPVLQGTRLLADREFSDWEESYLLVGTGGLGQVWCYILDRLFFSEVLKLRSSETDSCIPLSNFHTVLFCCPNPIDHLLCIAPDCIVAADRKQVHLWVAKFQNEI